MLRLLLVFSVLLSVLGCTAGPPTYGIGPYVALSAKDAETAYVQKRLNRVADGATYDTEIRAIKAPMPDYPVELLSAGIQGGVVLRFTINESGLPIDLTIVSMSHRELGRLVIGTVRRWEFEPLLLRGQPARGVFEMPFSFSIKKDRPDNGVVPIGVGWLP